MSETARDPIERAYREHAARIWRAVYAYARNPEIATDAVAEAFAEVLRRGDAVRDPVAWAWRTAFRVAAGELKDRGRTVAEMPDGTTELREPALDLVRALQRLTPKQRAAFLLHHYAGYPVREIAPMVGSTPAAVKVHLSAARKRLRRLLEDRDAGP